jgi:uncharacterized metal-binding protein YceD (DUF177 family)
MTPELSRSVVIDRIPSAGLEQRVEANAAECAAIAARLRLPGVAALACTFHLTPGAGMVRAEGHLEAEVTRTCVVTLEDFQQHVAEDFAVRFVPAGTESDEDPESEDEIPIESGLIDLGEATVEQLALALDPYPRMPGATLPKAAAEEDENPFAALSRLRSEQ